MNSWSWSAKIVQTERNAKQNTKFLFCIAEVQPIFGRRSKLVFLNFRKLRGVQKLQKFRSSDITTTNDH